MCWFPGSSSLRECVNALIFQGDSPQISPLIPSHWNPLNIGVGRIYSPRFPSSSLSLSLFPLLQRSKSSSSESLTKLFVCVCLRLFTEPLFFSRRSIVRQSGSVFEGKTFLCRTSDRSAECQVHIDAAWLCSGPERVPPWHFLTRDYNWLVRVSLSCTGAHLAVSNRQVSTIQTCSLRVWHTFTQNLNLIIDKTHLTDRYQRWMAHLLCIGALQPDRKQQRVLSNERWSQVQAAVN